jgi:pectinesterase
MAPRRFLRSLAAAASLAIASGAAAGETRVLLAGDSTMAPRNGYGDALCELLRPRVTCINLARNGRSTRTFRSDGSWERVTTLLADREANRDTYVFVQLGHNDQPEKAERSTDLETEYPANIARYVDEIEAAGARPVLVTPLTRRPFRDGALVNDLAPWADAVRRIAKARQLPLLDLNADSAAAVSRLGEVAADALAMQPPDFDHTHLGTEGAHFFARMVFDEIAKALPSLATVSAARPQLREAQARAYAYREVLRGADAWDPLAAKLPDGGKLKSDYVVDASSPADGKARFRTVQGAVNAALTARSAKKRVVILVKPGTYRELLYVPQAGVAITIVGATPDASATRVIANLDARMTGERYAQAFGAQFTDAPASVAAMFDSLKRRANVSTPGSAVAWIRGNGFVAKDITFENGYNRDGNDESRGADGRPLFSQAVALMVDGADRIHFDNVRFIGFQDTIYLKASEPTPGNRVFIDRSYIEGDMDFIFGDATAWFQRTEIRSLGRRPVHYVVAPSTHYETRFGFVFNDCRFTSDGTPNAAAGSFKLARQWFRGQRCSPYGTVINPPGYACTLAAQDAYEAPTGTIAKATLETVGKTIVMNSRIGAHIDRARPWSNWNANGTIRYRPVQHDSDDWWNNLVAAGIDPDTQLGQAARKMPVEPFLAEYRNTDE